MVILIISAAKFHNCHIPLLPRDIEPLATLSILSLSLYIYIYIYIYVLDLWRFYGLHESTSAGVHACHGWWRSDWRLLLVRTCKVLACPCGWADLQVCLHGHWVTWSRRVAKVGVQIVWRDLLEYIEDCEYKYMFWKYHVLTWRVDGFVCLCALCTH